MQGIILSSLGWGSILTELPASILAHKFGIKRVFSVCIALSALVISLTPLAVQYGNKFKVIQIILDVDINDMTMEKIEKKINRILGI